MDFWVPTWNQLENGIMAKLSQAFLHVKLPNYWIIWSSAVVPLVLSPLWKITRYTKNLAKNEEKHCSIFLKNPFLHDTSIKPEMQFSGTRSVTNVCWSTVNNCDSNLPSKLRHQDVNKIICYLTRNIHRYIFIWLIFVL